MICDIIKKMKALIYDYRRVFCCYRKFSKPLFSFKLFQTDDYYQADDNEGDDTDDDISDAVELRFISFTGPKNRVTVVKKNGK